MFYNCPSLVNVKLGDEITSIEDGAFELCTSLVSIEIPTSVLSIKDEAFKFCTYLNSISYNGTMAEWNDIEKGVDWEPTNSYTVYCTDGNITK